MKISLLPFLAAIILASCTHIVATNFPGKPKDKLPASWEGNYSIKLPGFLSMGEPMDSSSLTISRDRIVWKQSDKISVYSLSDSLRYSQIGKVSYLSMYNSHGQYTVFKVKEVKDGLNLYGLTADDEIEEDQLKPYFRNVSEHLLDSGNNNTGIRLYEVTIDDSRLDAYFESGIPGRSPIELRKVKN